MDLDDYAVEVRRAVAANHLKRAGVRVFPRQAVTYVMAGASGMSKAIPIQPVERHSYRVEPYLRVLEKATYTIMAPILRSLRATMNRI